VNDRPVRLAVLDYGAGNLLSLCNALERVGAEVRIAALPDELTEADGLVVPGVGASGPAMARLRRSGLAGAIREAVDRDIWYLGVCLGLQLLFERSEEDGARGLGLVEGNVRPIPDAPRLPHIGWNQVEVVRPHALVRDLPTTGTAYFVHSFAGQPADARLVVAETEHGGRFPSVVAAGRLLGVQFHPERSGEDGLRLLAAFVRLVSGAASVPATGEAAGPAVAVAG
jgi:glutamine amidotransferase